jgi:hypothetical protein
MPVFVFVVVSGLLALVPSSIVVVYEPCMLIYFAFSVFEPLGFVYLALVLLLFMLVHLAISLPRSAFVVIILVVLHGMGFLVVVWFGGFGVAMIDLGVVRVWLILLVLIVAIVIAAIVSISQVLVIV